MIVLAQAMIFILALGGIGLFSILALRAAGPAFSRARPPMARLRAGAATLACIAGVIGSAAAGFWGIGWLMYLAQS